MSSDIFVASLDPSSTNCGWALFKGVQLLDWGTVKCGRMELNLYATHCAKTILKSFVDHGGWPVPEVWYEINDGQTIERKRQKSMRRQAQATGRILQAIGVDGNEFQADRRTKETRAIEISMIYDVPDNPGNEHALDAIAVGHAVVTDPKRLAGISRE